MLFDAIQNREKSSLTDHPVGPFEQRSTFIFAPYIDPAIHLNPPRYLLQSFRDAFDLGFTDVAKTCGRMPIERGQSDVVKVYEPDLGHTPRLLHVKTEHERERKGK